MHKDVTYDREIADLAGFRDLFVAESMCWWLRDANYKKAASGDIDDFEAGFAYQSI